MAVSENLGTRIPGRAEEYIYNPLTPTAPTVARDLRHFREAAAHVALATRREEYGRRD